MRRQRASPAAAALPLPRVTMEAMQIKPQIGGNAAACEELAIEGGRWDEGKGEGTKAQQSLVS